MSRILDEMIQDRVETGHLVRGSRGSVRVANDQKAEAIMKSANASLDSILDRVSVGDESKQVTLEV